MDKITKIGNWLNTIAGIVTALATLYNFIIPNDFKMNTDLLNFLLICFLGIGFIIYRVERAREMKLLQQSIELQRDSLQQSIESQRDSLERSIDRLSESLNKLDKKVQSHSYDMIDMKNGINDSKADIVSLFKAIQEIKKTAHSGAVA